MQFGNRLLDGLSANDRRRLGALVETVSLGSQQYTNHRDARMTHVDFPSGALMSVVATLANGGTCEVAVVGLEGFVEIDAALESRVAGRSSFCQVAGTVVRMPIDVFLAELESNRAFAVLVRRSVRARSFVTEQTAACNAKHSMVERCARWLLMVRERTGSDGFRITQDFLAMMLGVRRASVTIAARALQAAGTITYYRGEVRILDRSGLGEAACECYEISRAAIERAFSSADQD